MIRRDFLRIAGATPLIVGLDRLFAQDDGIPAWYTNALKRLKATGRHGIVFVVPVDADERAAWAQAFLDLVDADNADVREVLGLGVVVCVTPEVAARTVRSGGSKDNRFLLDADGKTLASDSVEGASLAPEAFIKASREWLHGKDNERLKAAADAHLKAAPDSVRTALDKLALESIEARDEARGVLQAKADGIFALLVWTRLTTKNRDVSASIEFIIKGWSAAAGRVPFGAQVVDLPVKGRECNECGMMRVRPEHRRLLTFLVK
jgi:hypothetical protein